MSSTKKSDIRNRHRLRRKAARDIIERLNDIFSIEIDPNNIMLDLANTEDLEILIIDNEAIGFVLDGEPCFSLRGLIRFRPTSRFVTVDMGAVKFVSNGADVMAPGIIAADDEIQRGDIVWVRDERNFQPLAVGRALMTGPEMVEKKSDKAIESLHFVGDRLWNLTI